MNGSNQLTSLQSYPQLFPQRKHTTTTDKISHADRIWTLHKSENTQVYYSVETEAAWFPRPSCACWKGAKIASFDEIQDKNKKHVPPKIVMCYWQQMMARIETTTTTVYWKISSDYSKTHVKVIMIAIVQWFAVTLASSGSVVMGGRRPRVFMTNMPWYQFLIILIKSTYKRRDNRGNIKITCFLQFTSRCLLEGSILILSMQ